MGSPGILVPQPPMIPLGLLVWISMYLTDWVLLHSQARGFEELFSYVYTLFSLNS